MKLHHDLCLVGALLLSSSSFAGEEKDGAAESAPDESEWDISEPHGPIHEVDLDLDEGTWVSVSVHGDQVVFDLLGDIWSVPLAGGEADRLTEGPAWDVQPTFSPDGTRIAFASDRSGNENIWIMAADGSDPEAFTEEDVARATHPVWDPASPYLLYRRRTVDTRSIGVTEIWQRHLKGGDGFALTKLDQHPHAGEPWPIDDRWLLFSSRQGRFSYDQNPVSGLWSVMRLDRDSGDLRPIARGPGSASRPTVSPDGSTVYFVARQRTQTVLEALDIATGTRRVLASWLSPDELEGFALHGTYPRMDFTDDGDLVLWAQGKLWRFDPRSGERAEIPFRAKGSFTLHDVARPTRGISSTVRARVLRWPSLSSRGSWAFSAMGAAWVRDPKGSVRRVSPASGFAPAWSPTGQQLAYTSFTDDVGGRLHIRSGSGRIQTLPVVGQLTNPTWSDDGRSLVVLRGAGGHVSPDLGREAWYDVLLLQRKGRKWSSQVVTSVDAVWGSRKQRLRVRNGRLWFLEHRNTEPRAPQSAVLVSVALDGTDKRDHVALGRAVEAAIDPDFRRIAYKLDHQLYVAALPPHPRNLDVAALPTKQVTQVVGDWVGWSADGTEVTWAEGPVLKRRAVSDLWDHEEDEDEDEDEEKDEDEDEADPLAEDPEIRSLEIELSVPRARPRGAVVLRDANVITMVGEEVLDGVDVVVERDRITAIGPDLPAPPGAVEIDCASKTVIPGLVDVHAHLHFSSGDVLPEQEWRYQVALDFGVTTVHDPSTLTDLAFTQREMVEAGFMKGPRVFSTGAVLYGALSRSNAKTPSLDAARAHVRRLKTAGATSVKVYQQSQRDRRQWYLQACAEEDMLCVPEGGGDLWMDLGMVVDGYPAMEHALPTAPLHRDVLELFAASTQGSEGDGFGTFYTPTLQVAYGGLGAHHFFVQRDVAVDDPRLRRHTPPRQLEALLWRSSVMAHPEDWRFRQTARDAAALRAAGGRVTLGAHGELQGLGVHWELWSLGGPGALSPHHALQAATIDGARYIGIDAHVGTVEVGKLADLVILDADPLEDLGATTQIHGVLKNGELFR